MSTSRRTVVAGITASPLAFGQALPAFAQKKIVLGFSQIGAERPLAAGHGQGKVG
jgi:hypothetical protein